MINEIKVFKLKYSGDLEEISTENLLSNFTLFDILTFYDINQKRLYIWVSKKVSHTLKSHIPSIREIFLRNYPQFKVIRNIIIEQDLEPANFFDIIGISEKRYRDHFKQLEFKLLPVLSEIYRLKESIDKYFESENYKEAANIAQKVLKLAQEIDDYSLERDMLNFIEEMKLRAKAKQNVREIETEAEIKLKVFENLIRAENYKEAHKIAQDFKDKYQNNFNLHSIQYAQDLLLKDENIVYNLREEQRVLEKNFEVIGKKIEKLIEAKKILHTGKMIKEAEILVDKIIDRTTLNKFDSIKRRYQAIKINQKNALEELSKSALSLIDKRKFLDAIEIFDQIIDLLENSIQ
ncbi:MAG: hypothetical protein ACFFBH_04435 [Promethearchaeota archaeon]